MFGSLMGKRSKKGKKDKKGKKGKKGKKANFKSCKRDGWENRVNKRVQVISKMSISTMSYSADTLIIDRKTNTTTPNKKE